MSLRTKLATAFTSIGEDVKQLRQSVTIKEQNPIFTYTNNVLTRIDYQSGNYKIFTYTNSVLTQQDYVVGTTTYRKTFTYNINGSLASISETQF